jgi:serine/threonine protein kinase
MTEKLTVTSSHTPSLQQLEKFIADNKTSDADKLRGRALKGGGYELYIDHKSSSVFERMTKVASKRNRAAEAGIKMIFDGFQKEAKSRKVDIRYDKLQDLRADINLRTKMDGSHALRAGNVETFASRLKQIGAKLGVPLDPQANPTTAPKEPPPTPDQLVSRGVPLPFDRHVIMTVSDSVLKSANSGDRKQAINAIATAIQTGIRATKMNDEARYALAMSSGTNLKAQLGAEVAKYLTSHGSTVPDGLNALIDDAFRQFADGALGTRQTGTKEVDFGTPTAPNKVNLPVIEVNGTTYEPTNKILGEGGFGSVYLYRDPGSGDTVAFKMIKPPSDKRDSGAFEKVLGETINEVQIQRLGSTSGNENVLSVEGAVRLEGGAIGIALESAPHGSVFELAGGLAKTIGAGPGQLTDKEAKVVQLTQVKSMAEGLRALHQKGIFHFDMKSPNCLIGADGKLKIIDYGKSRIANSLLLKDLPSGLDNPRYLAPEIHIARRVVETGKQGEIDKLSTSLRTITDALVPLAPSSDANEVEAARKKLADNLAETLKSQFAQGALDQAQNRITQSADVWGIGNTLLEFVTGKQLLAHISFDTDVGDYLAKWASNPNSTAVSRNTKEGDPLPPTALCHSTGDPDFDDLLDRLLHPDPTQRSLDLALNHKAFQTKGVGDGAVDALMPALTAVCGAVIERDALGDGDLALETRNVARQIASEVVAGQLPPDLVKAIQGRTAYTQQEEDDFIAKLAPDQRDAHEATIRNVIGIYNRVAARTVTLAEVDQLLLQLSDADKAKIRNIGKLQTARDQWSALDAEVQKQQVELAKFKPGLGRVI